ncbi:hypothetical protein C8Q76DRAFT_861906 [Earliella scabrosa]|nr:hypothetical protein C8Q76DRAFT_861906 [Earliella scabrosa]
MPPPSRDLDDPAHPLRSIGRVAARQERVRYPFCAGCLLSGATCFGEQARCNRCELAGIACVVDVTMLPPNTIIRPGPRYALQPPARLSSTPSWLAYYPYYAPYGYVHQYAPYRTPAHTNPHHARRASTNTAHQSSALRRLPSNTQSATYAPYANLSYTDSVHPQNPQGAANIGAPFSYPYPHPPSQADPSNAIPHYSEPQQYQQALPGIAHNYQGMPVLEPDPHTHTASSAAAQSMYTTPAGYPPPASTFAPPSDPAQQSYGHQFAPAPPPPYYAPTALPYAPPPYYTAHTVGTQAGHFTYPNNTVGSDSTSHPTNYDTNERTNTVPHPSQYHENPIPTTDTADNDYTPQQGTQTGTDAETRPHTPQATVLYETQHVSSHPNSMEPSSSRTVRFADTPSYDTDLAHATANARAPTSAASAQESTRTPATPKESEGTLEATPDTSLVGPIARGEQVASPIPHAHRERPIPHATEPIEIRLSPVPPSFVARRAMYVSFSHAVIANVLRLSFTAPGTSRMANALQRMRSAVGTNKARHDLNVPSISNVPRTSRADILITALLAPPLIHG